MSVFLILKYILNHVTVKCLNEVNQSFTNSKGSNNYIYLQSNHQQNVPAIGSTKNREGQPLDQMYCARFFWHWVSWCLIGFSQCLVMAPLLPVMDCLTSKTSQMEIYQSCIIIRERCASSENLVHKEHYHVVHSIDLECISIDSAQSSTYLAPSLGIQSHHSMKVDRYRITQGTPCCTRTGSAQFFYQITCNSTMKGRINLQVQQSPPDPKERKQKKQTIFIQSRFVLYKLTGKISKTSN